jgi:hypothetical protein
METRELDSWPPSSSTTRFSIGRNWKSHMLENLERQLLDLIPSYENIRQPGSTVSRFYSGILVNETNSQLPKIIFLPSSISKPHLFKFPSLVFVSLFLYTGVFIFCPFFIQISPRTLPHFLIFPQMASADIFQGVLSDTYTGKTSRVYQL